jgi:hypothetical protein
MTPTAMESGTIAEIDGWPGAMNMLRLPRRTRLHKVPDAIQIRKKDTGGSRDTHGTHGRVMVVIRVISYDGNLIYDDLQINDLT